MKESIGRSHPELMILNEVVTIFLSPTESCRKMKYMPVLTKEGKELTQCIENVEGIAPQYSAIFEAKMIADLMVRDSSA